MKFLLSILRWFDKNIERILILFAYSSMALIIVFAVVQRFTTGNHAKAQSPGVQRFAHAHELQASVCLYVARCHSLVGIWRHRHLLHLGANHAHQTELGNRTGYRRHDAVVVLHGHTVCLVPAAYSCFAELVG